jgi:predicted O-methyltransferase YrrM
LLLIRNKRIRQIAGIVETFNLLALRLLIKDPSQARLFPGKVFREFMSLVGFDHWACRDIYEIFPDLNDTLITLQPLPGKGINTAVDELAYMALITKAIRPRKIFEIGTFRGRTALNFALNSPDDCITYTLDLPPGDRESGIQGVNLADRRIMKASSPGIDYKGSEVDHKIEQLYGNSVEFDFSPYSGEIDIVFVDGAHHYEAVRSDSLNALKLTKPGGCIIWHDFANYGDYNDVSRAVLDCLPGEQVIQIAATELAIYRVPPEEQRRTG